MQRERQDSKAELGAVIRRWRARQSLTIETLGERAGLHKDDLMMIECGECDPAFSTVCAIAAGFGLSAGEMLSDDHEALADSALEMVRLFADAPEPISSALPGFLNACIAAKEAKARRRARGKAMGG